GQRLDQRGRLGATARSLLGTGKGPYIGQAPGIGEAAIARDRLQRTCASLAEMLEGLRHHVRSDIVVAGRERDDDVALGPSVQLRGAPRTRARAPAEPAELGHQE